MIPFDVFGSEAVAANLLQQVHWRDGVTCSCCRSDRIGSPSVKKFITIPAVSDPGDISACVSSQSTMSSITSTNPTSSQTALITGKGSGSTHSD